MLLYVHCFYDFQEPCISHQSLTRQQRRSWELNFETETSSRSPRLENLQIMPKCFYKFSKKCHHHFEVEILWKNFHFSYLPMLFLTCRYNRQEVRWIKEVSLNRIVAVFKVSKHDRFETDTKVQHSRILTLFCKMLQLNIAWSWQF